MADLISSSKANPCPICGREKDGDCRISADLVLCHHGSNHHPPQHLKRGEVITGTDGQQWAFTGDTNDGRAATFTTHKPLEVPSPDALTRGAEGVWRYSSTFYVCRFNGKKIRPLSWIDGSWRWRGPGSNRPMLLSHPLATRPNAAALIVEGEKAWDAARQLFPGLVVCCWSGGCSAISKTNFTALAGRKVVLWPDNDDAGRDAMQELAQVLHGIGATSVKVVANPADAPQGWDLADATDWTPADAAAWVKVNTSTVEKAAAVTTTKKRKTNKGGAAARSGSGRLAPDEVMESIPAMLGRLRLNTRSGDIISERRGILGANQINRLYLEFSQPGATWPKETTADAVSLLASRDAFDPVVEELQQNSAAPLSDDDWANLDQRLLGIDDPIARSFLPRFLIGAVARAFDPGCDWRQFPVLVGPQWIGKSALGRILFGGAHWVEGVGDLGKDALMRAHTAWGVELGELDGITRRSDQERLKTFLSEREDVFRKPYDKAPERYPRRFTFWGTSNGPPLRDGTGNSRFVCIRLPNKMLPLPWAEQHRGAIWARAVQEYRAGSEWRHCSEQERQLIAERNLNHQELDPWQEPLQARLEQWKTTTPGAPVTVSQALSWLDVPVERQNNAAAARIRTLMEAMEWTYARRCVQGENGKSLKRQGFWPVSTESERTHRTHRDTPRCVRVEASEEAGSQLPDTPDTPKREKLKTQVTAPPPPPAENSTTRNYAGKVGQLGVSGASSRSDPNQRNGSTRTHRGVSGHTAVCPPTIPGFVDPTPAPIGSGADAMDDDGDDPSWAKRPEAA